MTLQEFSDAVLRASYQLFITPEEADAAIERFKIELQLEGGRGGTILDVG